MRSNGLHRQSHDAADALQAVVRVTEMSEPNLGTGHVPHLWRHASVNVSGETSSAGKTGKLQLDIRWWRVFHHNAPRIDGSST